MADETADSETSATELVLLLRDLVAEERSANGKLREILDVQRSISDTLTSFFTAWQASQTPPPDEATGAVLTVGGKIMAAGITVDQTGNASLGFTDDKGDPVGPPPGDGSGIVVTFTSDNDAVATAGASTQGTDANGNETFTAVYTPVAEGTFNAGATVANTSGATLVDADGTTDFNQPAAVNVTVSAGQSADATLTFSASGAAGG